MAYIVVVQSVTADMDVTCTGMAYIVMAKIFMACTVMAYAYVAYTIT